MGRRPLAAAVSPEMLTTGGLTMWPPSLEEPVYTWLIFILATHFISSYIFSRVGPFKAKPSLVAHQAASVLPFVWCVYYGIKCWCYEDIHSKDRLYGHVEGAFILGKVNIALQLYDLASTFIIPDLRKPEMLLHHFVAAVLGILVLQNGYAEYYVVFFMGIGEISTLPLLFVDVLRYLPQLGMKLEPLTSMLRMTFALLFLTFRVVYWPYVCWFFWRDNYVDIAAGTCKYPKLTAFFLASNAFLTMLQIYWGSLIIRALVKLATGAGGSGGDGKAQKMAKVKLNEDIDNAVDDTIPGKVDGGSKEKKQR